MYIHQQPMTIYVTESRDSNSRYVVKAIKSFNGPRAWERLTWIRNSALTQIQIFIHNYHYSDDAMLGTFYPLILSSA